MHDVQSFFGSLSSWALYALFALLPLFFVPLPWVTLVQGKMLLAIFLIGIAMVSSVVAAFMCAGLRLPRAWILLVALLLPLVYGISIVASHATAVSIWGSGVEQDTLAAVCLWYVTLVGVAAWSSDNVIKSIYIVRALLFGSLMLYLTELFHLLSPWFASFGGFFAAQTANPIGGWYELGIFSAFILFLALAGLRTPVARGWWRIVAISVAVLSLILLMVVNLPAIWIAFSVLATAYIVLDISAGRHWYNLFYLRTWQPYLLWLGIVVLSILLFFFGTQAASALLPARFQITSSEVRPSWQGTYFIGKQALIDPARLAFGAGPNTFMRQWSLYKPVTVNQTPFWDTDFDTGVGFIPTSLITIGLVGGIAWVLLVLSIIWLLISLAHSTPRQGAALLLEPLLLGALFLVACHVVYAPGPVLSILAFLLIGVALGFAASMGKLRTAYLPVRGGDALVSVPSAIGLVLFVVVAVASCGGLGRVIFAEALINESISTFNSTGDLVRSTAEISTALKIYPSDARGERAAVELGILQIQKLAAVSDTAGAAQLRSVIQETIQHGLNAVSINSADYQNWLELANLYQQLAGVNIGGAYDYAYSAYAKFIAENPSNPIPYFKRAQLELIEKKADAAIQDLLTAVKLKPDFADAYYLASQVYASQGDFKSALIPAHSAAQIGPNDPLTWYNYGAIAYAAGDYGDAAVALEDATTLNPQYANALYMLGMTYYQLGRTFDAIDVFQKLDTIDPNQPAVQTVLMDLRTGKSLFPQSSLNASGTPPSAPGKKK